MAEIAYAEANPFDPGLTTVTWETLTEADTAGAYFMVNGPKRGCVTVTGTFGGATVVLQGSNDGTNWVTLTDLAGSAISVSAAGIAEFSTACMYVRASAGSGTGQDVDIIMALRKE